MFQRKGRLAQCRIKGRPWLGTYYLAGGTALALHLGHRLLEPLIEWNGLDLASILDIAFMKIVAISQRGFFLEHIEIFPFVNEKIYDMKIQGSGFEILRFKTKCA